MGRRHDRLNQGIAAVFGLDGSLDAERLHPEINRKLDSALWFSPRHEAVVVCAAPDVSALRRARTGQAIPAVAALAIERPTQALKFENQRFTLRSDAVGIRLATPVPVGFIEMSMILRVRHG